MFESKRFFYDALFLYDVNHVVMLQNLKMEKL